MRHSSSTDTLPQIDQRVPEPSARLITIVTSLIYFAYSLAMNSWGPLIPSLALHLAIPLDQMGLILVAWGVGFLPGALFGGPMLDRYPPRVVLFLATAILLAGIGLLLLSLYFSFATLVFLIISAGITGLGGGAIGAAGTALMGNLFPEKRGVAINLITLLNPLSALVISLVDSVLLGLFDNNPLPPVIFCFSIIALSLFSLFLLPNTEKHATQEAVHQEHTISSSNGIRQIAMLLPLLLPFIVAQFLTGQLIIALRTWTPSYLYVVYGQTLTNAALVSGLISGMAVLSRFGAVFLMGKRGADQTLILYYVLAGIGLLGMLWNPGMGMTIVAITISTMGLTPVGPTLTGIAQQRAQKLVGAVSGLMFFMIGVSNMFYNWIFGLLLIQAGSFWAVSLCFVSLLIAMGIMVGVNRRSNLNARMPV